MMGLTFMVKASIQPGFDLRLNASVMYTRAKVSNDGHELNALVWLSVPSSLGVKCLAS